jgi:hypothetical protein
VKKSVAKWVRMKTDHGVRLLRTPGLVGTDRLSLDLDGNRLESTEQGVYSLRVDDADTLFGCALRFTSLKPPQRHGIDGHVACKRTRLHRTMIGSIALDALVACRGRRNRPTLELYHWLIRDC